MTATCEIARKGMGSFFGISISETPSQISVNRSVNAWMRFSANCWQISNDTKRCVWRHHARRSRRPVSRKHRQPKLAGVLPKIRRTLHIKLEHVTSLAVIKTHLVDFGRLEIHETLSPLGTETAAPTTAGDTSFSKTALDGVNKQLRS